MMSDEPEMVRRVGQAISFELVADFVSKRKLDPYRAARAAIQAMRQPTNAMVEAAGAVSTRTEAGDCGYPPSVEDYWAAMVDAAHAPDQGERS